jgi:hypothetical protein
MLRCATTSLFPRAAPPACLTAALAFAGISLTGCIQESNPSKPARPVTCGASSTCFGILLTMSRAAGSVFPGSLLSSKEQRGWTGQCRRKLHSTCGPLLSHRSGKEGSTSSGAVSLLPPFTLDNMVPRKVPHPSGLGQGEGSKIGRLDHLYTACLHVACLFSFPAQLH